MQTTLMPFNAADGTYRAQDLESLLDSDDKLSPMFIETTHHEVVGRIKALRDESFDIWAAGHLHTFAYADVQFVAYASVGEPTMCVAK